MSSMHLSRYLSNHASGAAMALELLAQLEKVHADMPLADTVARLRAEITADRDVLESFMASQGVAPTAAQKMTGWLGDKLAEIKLRLDDRSGGPLHLLEALEILVVGVHGKECLWHSLRAGRVPGLSEDKLQELIDRAQDQHDRLETLRRDAAKQAFGHDEE